MNSNFEVVSREVFHDFVDTYPRKLSCDICGICEPALVGYYDFDKAKEWNALIAKFHKYDDTSKRIYEISKHLLGEE